MNSCFHMVTRISFDEEKNETLKGWVNYKMRIIYRWFLLVVFIYYTCKFFVSGEDYKYEYQFEVEKDLTRVEDFIIKYSKQMKNRFRAAFKKIPGMSTKLDAKKDVCEFHKDIKTFMCKVLIKLNNFGLKFVDEGIDGMNCGRQEISLRLRRQNKLKTRDIKMFRCPTLQYLSLETEEVVELPESYYISNTQKAGSACLYIKQGQGYPIFPLQIVSNVDADALFLSLLNDYENSQNQESQRRYVSLITHFPTVHRQFSNFMDIKKESKPYQKFTQLYIKTSICGMPNAHKVYLCRSLTRFDYFKSHLDHEGYDEAKCRREEVLSHRKNYQRFTMALFKCPPLYLTNKDSKQYLEHSLFLSTNSVEKSIIVYHRLNFKGKAIRLDSYAVNLDYEILSMDRRRTREILNPHYPAAEMTDMQQEILAPDPPTQRDLLTTLFTVTFDRKIVEDNVTEFVEMRTVKKPYAHFQRTFASINVTGLRQDEIIRLCKFIMEENISYHLTLPDVDDLNLGEHGLREPIHVMLIMRDTEKLPQDRISSRQCPPVMENPFEYFVSASAKTDAVIMYVKYDHEDYYSVPEAFVDKIDKKRVLTDQPASTTRSISFRP